MTCTMTEAKLLDFLDPFDTLTPEQIAADRTAHEEAKGLIWVDGTCSCGKVAAHHPSGWCQECVDECDDLEEGAHYE